MTQRVLDCLDRLRGVLADVEAGSRDPADLLGPLWALAGAFRNCGCEAAGLPDYEWCSRAHGLRKVVGDAVTAGGKTLVLALREVRRRLGPLLDLAAAARDGSAA